MGEQLRGAGFGHGFLSPKCLAVVVDTNDIYIRAVHAQSQLAREAIISEAPTLEFIQRRLDSVQADVADVRRRMVAIGERFGSLETRFGAIETRIGAMETRIAGMETHLSGIEARLDHAAERAAKTDESLARILLLLEAGKREGKP